MKSQIVKPFVKMLAVLLGIACIQSASAQTFKKVKVAGIAPIVQVASGGSSAWALASNGHPYVFKGKTFALANSITLSQIAVGGGNAAQADEVWGLTSAGLIYHASKSGTTWTFSQVPGLLDLVQVGPGYQDSCHPYETWGLNTGSQIYRYNYCTGLFEQQSGFLCDIHVGGTGQVWGAECGPRTYRFNFVNKSFDQIPNGFTAFPQLSVGPNGQVWAEDTGSGLLYKFDDFSGFANFGCCVNHVEAGGNGVWILDGTDVYRFEPSTLFFVQVFGTSLTSLTVGSGGGVWGINASKQVYAFSTP